VALCESETWVAAKVKVKLGAGGGGAVFEELLEEPPQLTNPKIDIATKLRDTMRNLI
jgi:hypothetical protein